MFLADSTELQELRTQIAIVVVFLWLALSNVAIGEVANAPMTIDLDSSILRKKTQFNVILPVGYAHDQRRYPVLYLLHGFGENYNSWLVRSNVVEYARAYPIIIVLLDGGTSWYTNGQLPGSRWEDYFTTELLPYIREHYRTLQGQRMSAIAGFSMGGFGALKLALKYRTQFSFAASLSGSLKITDWAEDQKRPPEVLKSAIAAFGPSGSPARAANSLSSLLDVKDAEPPFIYLDCGTDDDLFPASREFSGLLHQKHILHEYRERPGGHDWKEWDHQIQEVLSVLAEHWELTQAEVPKGQ